MLGGVIEQNDEYNFTTWKYENNSLFWGHYHGKNYEVAKEDFAARANLVNENKIFNEEELEEICKCISKILNGNYNISVDQQNKLKKINEKIMDNDFDLDEHMEEIEVQLLKACQKSI